MNRYNKFYVVLVPTFGMLFKEFCTEMDTVSEHRGNKKTDVLAEVFEGIDDDELSVVAHFCKGSIFPDLDKSSKKIGMSDARIIESLSDASGLSEEEIEDINKELGDLGLVCEEIDLGRESGQVTFGGSSLSVREVYEKLDDIAGFEGSGSQEKKIKSLSGLLSSCSGVEGRYIVRLILDKMRIGVGNGTIRKAISKAFDIEEDKVKKAIMYTPDVGEVAVRAKNGEIEDIMGVNIGMPIQSMLAQNEDIDAILDEFGGEAAVEYKYDGFRLSMHKDGDKVELFSRNLENLTESLPDVVEIIRENISYEKAVLDGEVIAYDENGDPVNFQKILTRMKRKYDIEETMDEIELEIKLFDILHKDGVDFIEESLRERRNVLEEGCKNKNYLSFFEIVSDTDSIRDIKAEAIEYGEEGLVVKDPSSGYSSGRSGKEWLKLKGDTETLDCVITGGEWGEGNRSNWISSLTLSIRDEDELKTIGKVGSGFTEEQLEVITRRLEKLIQEEDGKEVSLRPEVVVEVYYEDLQKSPTYESGYALRFPRFITIREDKDINNMDTMRKVSRLYNNKN